MSGVMMNADLDRIATNEIARSQTADVSTVQSYTFNGKTIQIELRSVPTLSYSSLDILQRLQVQPPEAFRTAAPLEKRIQKMEKTAKLLREIEANPNINKLFAVGQGIGGIAILVFAFIAFYLPDGGIVTGSFGGFGLLCMYNALDLWTKESALLSKLAKEKNALLKDLPTYQIHNNRVLPNAHQFYTTQAEKILPVIDALVQECEWLLAKVDHPVPNPRRRGEIEEYISHCLVAKLELQRLIQFYTTLAG